MQPPPYSPPPERHPHRPSSCRHTPTAISFLRVVVWLSPSVTTVAALAGVFFLGIWAWLALIAPCLVLAIAAGFDAILSRSTPMTDGTPALKPLIRHCIRYTCVQIIFAPVAIVVFIVAITLVSGLI